MFNSVTKALVAAIMGILYIVQTYTGMSFWWATPDSIATIIGLLTPVLVWSVLNKEVTRYELAGGRCGRRGAPWPRGRGVPGGAVAMLLYNGEACACTLGLLEVHHDARRISKGLGSVGSA